MVAALHLFTSVMARGRTSLLVSHRCWGLIYSKPSVDTDFVKSGCSSIGWAYTPSPKGERERSSYSSTTSQHIILLPSPCSLGTTDKLALLRHFGKSGDGTSFVHTLYQFALVSHPLYSPSQLPCFRHLVSVTVDYSLVDKCLYAVGHTKTSLPRLFNERTALLISSCNFKTALDTVC
mgnify:FL=1